VRISETKQKTEMKEGETQKTKNGRSRILQVSWKRTGMIPQHFGRKGSPTKERRPQKRRGGRRWGGQSKTHEGQKFKSEIQYENKRKKKKKHLEFRGGKKLENHR